MSQWIALGRSPTGVVAYAVSDGAIDTAEGKTREEALARFSTSARVIEIGEGSPAALPASVLPETGTTLPALTQISPADVISGWVRLWIAGYLETHPNWDGVICALHGDIVHFIHVSADEVVSSLSSLTPRLFAAMGLHAEPPSPDAITDTLSRPERLATQLRAAEVLGDASAGLGHLIGADLAATRAYWLGQQVTVIGDGPMASAYETAFCDQGVPVHRTASDDVLPAGLLALGTALSVA